MKKQFPQVNYLLMILLIAGTYSLRAQPAPHTTAGTVIACPGSTFTVHVKDTGFNSITSFNLRIEYDSLVMTFDAGLSAINSQLTGDRIINKYYVGPGSVNAIGVLWQAPFPYLPKSLSDTSSVVTLGFNYINGTTSVHFNNSSNLGGDCEYASFNVGIPITLIDTPTIIYYHDGKVSSGAGFVTGGSNITFGNSTGTLTLNGYVGNIIKWQKQYDGGGFVDITPFNTNPTMSEIPVYTGTWDYRAIVQNGSCSPVPSAPTTVTVTAVNGAKTWNGSASIDWTNVNNWTPPGIPMLTENVTIPTGLTNYPTVSIQGMGCNNLTIAGGATLNINPGIHLTINGTLNVGP
jgi:hypothetical protein